MWPEMSDAVIVGILNRMNAAMKHKINKPGIRVISRCGSATFKGAFDFDAKSSRGRHGGTQGIFAFYSLNVPAKPSAKSNGFI